jgi:hypothetical protein
MSGAVVMHQPALLSNLLQKQAVQTASAHSVIAGVLAVLALGF